MVNIPTMNIYSSSLNFFKNIRLYKLMIITICIICKTHAHSNSNNNSNSVKGKEVDGAIEE